MEEYFLEKGKNLLSTFIYDKLLEMGKYLTTLYDLPMEE